MFNTRQLYLMIKFGSAEMAVNLHLHVGIPTDLVSKEIDTITFNNDGRRSNEHLQRLQQNS